MIVNQVNMVDLRSLNNFVTQTYGRPYNFQQQDGCRSRGLFYFTVPDKYPIDFKNDTVPDEVNKNEMGVSFAAWLACDLKMLKHVWERSFYPDISMIVNDLHQRGLIDAGSYCVDIDW